MKKVAQKLADIVRQVTLTLTFLARIQRQRLINAPDWHTDNDNRLRDRSAREEPPCFEGGWSRGREHASDHAPAWIELAEATKASPDRTRRAGKGNLR
jgi:hypothetical protein